MKEKGIDKMRKTTTFILLALIILISGCSKNKEFDYIEESVSVIYDDYTLPGILTLPTTKSKVPAVIFVHGSGLADMDETIGVLKPFEEMAQELAKRGIASIRYDKVTYTYQQELSTKYNFTIYDEYISSAIAACDILIETDEIDSQNIFVIGHSQGGQIAPFIVDMKEGIKGAIIMAGSTKHILDTLMEQLEDQNSTSYDEYLHYYNIVKDINEVNEVNEKYFYFGAYSAYWENYNSLNFEEKILKVSDNHPLLIMQGGKDLQVKTDDFFKYQEILENKENVEFNLYDNLNHAFVDGTDETLQTSYRKRKNIPVEVIDDMSNWIKNIKNDNKE